MRQRAASTARRNGGAGLAASAAFHLLVFVLLGLALRYTPIFPVAPTLEVRLVTLSRGHVEAKPPPPRPAAAPSAPSPAQPLAPHIVPTIAPGVPTIAAPAPAAPPALPGVEALRRGLRLTAGCAHPDDFNLSPAERETCRQMTARTHEAAPTYGALSPHMRERVARDNAEQDYRGSTSMNDYPGAHCLGKESCTPDQPTPPADPGREDCPWPWCHMVGR